MRAWSAWFIQRTQVPLGRAMSRFVTVTPDMSLEECCRIMEEKLIRRVPVVDERGSCVGIIALADIALHTGKNVAGHIVKEVSGPTSSASAASAAGH